MTDLMAVSLTALLSENMVLVTCIGAGTHLDSFRHPRQALRSGLCLTAVMVLGALCSWLLDFLLLSRFGWEHLRTLAFALLIPSLVVGLRSFLKVCVPELSRRVDVNLGAVSSNCAALGTALLISQRSYGLGTALAFALFSGIGVTLALASMASLQKEVDLDRCPRPFRGIPIYLLTAGLMAMALMGFYGLDLG